MTTALTITALIATPSVAAAVEFGPEASPFGAPAMEGKGLPFGPPTLEGKALGAALRSNAQAIEPYSQHPSELRPFAICPLPKPGEATCFAAGAANPRKLEEAGLPVPNYEGSGKEGGFSPADLRSAYKLPTEGGEGRTVAITIAYDDPNAYADLSEYRKHYELPKLLDCSEVKEGEACFKKVNQKGETGNYPAKNAEWAQETSLDLDMVSATCPKCHIILVEANSPTDENLGTAVQKASEMGATVISDSWGGGEFSEETSFDHYFSHAGIPTLFASGDFGYGAEYPASSTNVVAVGGTSLKKAENTRGWSESAWGGAGSGCSRYEEKPAWQQDKGCAKRTVADASAVADPATPVSVYDSFEHAEKPWLLFGGTSVATPLVAGVEAQATEAVRKEGGEAFYRHSLFDVTSGYNGYCRGYLCHAEAGYDGPTGWGTPDGPLELVTGFHAITARATGSSLTSATLQGYVDPEGSETTYQFEYGPTGSYGSKAPVPPGGVGSGVDWQAVSQSVTGLAPETTYHYRLTATNGSGTVYGADREFSTTRWTVQSAPLPSEKGTCKEEELCSAGTQVDGVSCEATNSNACMLVGSYYQAPMAETWNGVEWQAQSPTLPSEGTSRFYGVSCPNVECTAVGAYVDPTSHRVLTLAERRYSNGEWKIQSTPNPGGNEQYLLGVSCTSSTACIAVGYRINSSMDYTLSEIWNGTSWSEQQTPNPPSSEGSYLESISCSSANACTAVGQYRVSKAWRALVERWNGSAWTWSSMPEPSEATETEPHSVSCPSATACTAVGSYTAAGFSGTKMLAENWNGTEWKIESTPAPSGEAYTRLRGVSCSSTTACTAVGNAGGEAVFSERWDGTEWKFQSTPIVDESAGHWWDGVACATSQVCVTVGQGPGPEQPELSVDRRLIPPTATTEAAANATETEATLNGTVNPNGSETKYFFEYGTTSSYGTKTTETSAGSGTSNVKVNQAITGLTTGTVYHYRLVASNSVGTAYGIDKTGTPGLFSFASTLGSQGSGNGQLQDPRSTAVDPEGHVWVADSGNNRVQEFSAAGTYIRQFGSKGTGNGQFEYPYGIATDSKGDLYVTDANNFRVQEFSSTGTYIRQFGTRGAGNGQFGYPTGIAIDSKGNVWVADSYEHNRVEEFSSEGTYIRQFGSEGTGNGQFKTPLGVAVDAENNVWVTDQGNDRVQEFSSEGKYIRQFGSEGTGNGQFKQPYGVAVNPEGDVLVTDATNNRVQEFSPTGTYILQFGTAGSGSGQFNVPAFLAADSHGNLWVPDVNNNRVQEWVPRWSTLGSQGSGNGQLQDPRSTAVDPEGHVWVADSGNNRVQEFSAAGTYIRQFGSKGTGNGQFEYPYGIATDSKGDLYVTDANNFRVQEFSSTGTYIRQFGTRGAGNGQFGYPTGIAIDSKGNVWVADSYEHNRVEEFSSEGTYIRQFGSEGTGNGQFKTPLGVAVDAENNVWVTDQGNDRVQEFSSEGKYIRQFGSEGTGNGQFKQPYGVAVNPEGDVLVTDATNNRVQEFSPTGTYILQFGTAGSGSGQFNVPAFLAADSHGNLWVPDVNNNRVQEWVP